MDADFVEIPLTKGKIALVSPEDYGRVSRFKWCASHNYAARSIGGKTTQSMHRFILNEPAGNVDHKDGNGFNNTRGNLHTPTVSVNTHRRHVRLSKSGFYGVSKHRLCERWYANIKVNYKTVYLGLFKSPEAAAVRYDQAALRVHGSNAMTNFVWQKQKTGWKRLH